MTGQLWSVNGPELVDLHRSLLVYEKFMVREWSDMVRKWSVADNVSKKIIITSVIIRRWSVAVRGQFNGKLWSANWSVSLPRK